MVFNSFEYLVFFTITVFFYYLLPRSGQNSLLLVASYIFYGWWDWRFLSLIFISTITDYICGLAIHKEGSSIKKKRYLFISIFINLSILGFFKYWNFFIDSLTALLLNLGLSPGIPTLSIILPVGISFYTFQTMTYSIDIYIGKIKPATKFKDFALFVAFFPQLVAGPIERASKLIPQIQGKRFFRISNFSRGLRLIFWGLFKKVFVADNLGIIVDQVYSNPNASGAEYVIATWAFAFQIYGDFSGYSDIARGTAKCLGFELMMNFKQPYFAINPSDFWKRWHISLSSWLRDYLYIPLGGNKGTPLSTYKNLMITMLLGGLWHGAAWNYVIWGAYQGLILSAHRLFNDLRNTKLSRNANPAVPLLKILIMFQVTCIGWFLFRAQSVEQIQTISQRVFLTSWSILEHLDMLKSLIFFTAAPIAVMGYQYFHYRQENPLQKTTNSQLWQANFINNSIVAKSMVYGVLTYLLCLYGAKARAFIYFQF